MKKKNTLLLLVLCITCLFALCACNASGSDSDSVIAIELLAYSSDVEIGSFSPSNYSLNVIYKSGKVDSVPLTDEMISDTEALKFYTYGTKVVTFSAYDLTCTHTFTVIQKQIKDAYLVGFVKNSTTQIYERTVQYTGQPFEVVVDGDIPAGAKISFSTGSSSYTDVGSYEFIVYITCDSYETKQLQGSFNITKAVYDMSSVHFKDIVGDTVHVTYSGEEIQLELDGEIPEGVTPSFKIQSLKSSEYLDSWPINAGNYLVSATFEADTICHEKIKDISTYLTIDKKEVSLTNVSFDDQEIVYDGQAHTFELTNEALLTDKSSTLSSLVTFEYESNVFTNAGTYLAIAKFSVLDSINYTVVDSLKANIVIKKADYDLSNVVFDNESRTYDEEKHRISISFKSDKDGNKTGLPTGVTVSYSINGSLVDYSNGEGVSDAGTHTIVASFKHSNANYNEIPDMTALLRIEQAEISFDSLEFVFSQENSDTLPESVIYTGESYAPVLGEPLPTGIKAVSYQYQYTVGDQIKTVDEFESARTYTLIANFTEIDSNYYCESSFTRSFEISVLTIKDSDLNFYYKVTPESDESVYTGQDVVFNYNGNTQYVELEVIEEDQNQYVSTKNGRMIKVEGIEYSYINASTSAIANGNMPGEYLQNTTFSYFNGLERITYTTSSSIPFSIIFEISQEDFIYDDIEILYSGNKINPIFTWNTSSENYNLIKDKFATIDYWYKPQGTNEEEYTQECLINVGVYDVKAVFSSYLTGKNGENTFDSVVATMTIKKRTLSAQDIMQMKISNVSTGDAIEAECQFKDTWEFKGYDGNQIKTFECNDVYVQEFNYKYDGKKRAVLAIDNLNKLIDVNNSKVTCYRLIGEYTDDDSNINYHTKEYYTKQLIQLKDNQEIVNLTDAGIYVYQYDIKVDSNNCELETDCDMYVQIKIDMLTYDKSYFEAQNVLKNNTSPIEFDISIIPFKLNAKISRYIYDNGTVSGISKTKPLAFADAVESDMAYVDSNGIYYYYVIFTISFETSNQSIDEESFNSALTNTENTSTGICYMQDKGEDSAGYITYEFKVKIKYVD